MTRRPLTVAMNALLCATLATTSVQAKQKRPVHHHRHHHVVGVDANGNDATVSRSCLTHETRALLEAAEVHFGVTFTLVSTCRPSAIIAGTHQASEHRYGRAVDLLVPKGTSKADVVHWFYDHAPGVTMTYRSMAHVHFDTGPYHNLACGGCGRPRRIRLAHGGVR
jgi:hypothetical protein